MSSTDLLGLFRFDLAVVLFDGLVGGLGLVPKFSDELLGGDLPSDFAELRSDRTVVMPFDNGFLLPGLGDPAGFGDPFNVLILPPTSPLTVVAIGSDLEMPFDPRLPFDGAPLELPN